MMIIIIMNTGHKQTIMITVYYKQSHTSGHKSPAASHSTARNWLYRSCRSYTHTKINLDTCCIPSTSYHIYIYAHVGYDVGGFPHL